MRTEEGCAAWELRCSCRENAGRLRSLGHILLRKEEEQKMNILRIGVLLALPLVTSGCVAVAAGTVGALIVDEGIIEEDGKFDPFENTELGRRIYD